MKRKTLAIRNAFNPNREIAKRITSEEKSTIRAGQIKTGISSIVLAVSGYNIINIWFMMYEGLHEISLGNFFIWGLLLSISIVFFGSKAVSAIVNDRNLTNWPNSSKPDGKIRGFVATLKNHMLTNLAGARIYNIEGDGGEDTFSTRIEMGHVILNCDYNRLKDRCKISLHDNDRTEDLTAIECYEIGCIIEQYQIKIAAKELGCEATLDWVAVAAIYHLDEIEAEDYVKQKNELRLQVLKTLYGYALVGQGLGVLQLPKDICDAYKEQIKSDRLTYAIAPTTAKALPAPSNTPFEDFARKAIKMFPRMTDAAGTPLAPLIEEHLPRMQAKRDKALEMACDTDKASLDKIYSDSVEIMQNAFEEGIRLETSQAKDDLLIELGFLKSRHPSESVLDR